MQHNEKELQIIDDQNRWHYVGGLVNPLFRGNAKKSPELLGVFFAFARHRKDLGLEPEEKDPSGDLK